MSSSRQKRNRSDPQELLAKLNPTAAATQQHGGGVAVGGTNCSKFSKPGFKTGNDLPPFVSNYKPYTSNPDASLLQTHVSCGKQWDSYYSNNGVNGYKDRHYIIREFVELRVALEGLLNIKNSNGEEKKEVEVEENCEKSGQLINDDKKKKVVPRRIHWMEVGCGVGNTVMPYLAHEKGATTTELLVEDEEEEGDDQPLTPSPTKDIASSSSDGEAEEVDNEGHDVPTTIATKKQQQNGGSPFAHVLKVTCLDISAVAIKLLRAHPLFRQLEETEEVEGGATDKGSFSPSPATSTGQRLLHSAYVHDLSLEPLTRYFTGRAGDAERSRSERVDETSVPLLPLLPSSLLQPNLLPDFITMIFVMCSIPLARHRQTVRHLATSIKPGGVLYFRDYCTSDMAEKRFQIQGSKKPKTIIDDSSHHTYLRSNGTLSHFFSSEEVVDLFTTTTASAGDGAMVSSPLFELLHIDTVKRTVLNRSTDTAMERRWLHARFRKL